MLEEAAARLAEDSGDYPRRGVRAVGFGSGGRIRTCDLRVMSPTSCLTAPPRTSREPGMIQIQALRRKSSAPDSSVQPEDLHETRQSVDARAGRTMRAVGAAGARGRRDQRRRTFAFDPRQGDLRRNPTSPAIEVLHSDRCEEQRSRGFQLDEIPRFPLGAQPLDAERRHEHDCRERPGTTSA